MTSCSPLIVHRPSQTFVGLRTQFIHALSNDANNLTQIGNLWDRFMPIVNGIPGRIGNDCLGLVYLDHREEASHPDERHYMAAVQTEPDIHLPKELVQRVTLACDYAVFTHRGPISSIAETIDFVYRVWLPASTFEHTEREDIERYGARFHPTADSSVMHYEIPVRRR